MISRTTQSPTSNVITFPNKTFSLPTAEQAFDVMNRLPPNELERLHSLLRDAWIVRPYLKKGA